MCVSKILDTKYFIIWEYIKRSIFIRIHSSIAHIIGIYQIIWFLYWGNVLMSFVIVWENVQML